MNSYKKSNPLDVYNFVGSIFSNTNNINSNQLVIKEIPHTQVTNLEQIAEGGFGVIYKANWLGDNVAVKRFNNSHIISKHFLNEVIDYIVITYTLSSML
jgi:serine/threonine protein kinase